MTLDDLEWQNRGFYGFFWWFRTATHILRVNCSKITTDLYNLCMEFLTWNRLKRSKSRSVRSEWLTHEGIKDGYPLKSHYFTTIGCTQLVTLSGECKWNAIKTSFHNHRVECAKIGEIKFCSQWAFKHAPLSRIPLCIS